jgi:hypothetical protein
LRNVVTYSANCAYIRCLQSRTRGARIVARPSRRVTSLTSSRRRKPHVNRRQRKTLLAISNSASRRRYKLCCKQSRGWMGTKKEVSLFHFTLVQRSTGLTSSFAQFTCFIVIFSQFTSHLDVIGEAMIEAGHTFVRIDGSVCAPKRIAAINSFNSNATCAPRFILCSLLASGTGINLTRANWCFMMDVWWNEAVESQAMDRSKSQYYSYNTFKH